MVPVQQVAAADEALAFSLAAIQKATAEGARIFAPVEIGSAIENRDTAVERRDVGRLGRGRHLCRRRDRVRRPGARDLDRASATGRRRRSSRTRRAASRAARPTSRAGRGARPSDVLVEFERVRTLSSSTAQVTFRDLSRLRLNPNSNAIIQRMRSDPLTGGEVTKVSLVNGDFYALLNQLGDRTAFEVEVPGLETADPVGGLLGQARRRGKSRFANYDAPGARDQPAAARRSASARTRARSCPQAGAAERTRVLARAELDAPFDGAKIYDPAVTLAWQPVRGRRGLLAGGGGRRRLQHDAGLRVGRARHQPLGSTSLSAGRVLLAGLLARPARAARACAA